MIQIWMQDLTRIFKGDYVKKNNKISLMRYWGPKSIIMSSNNYKLISVNCS